MKIKLIVVENNHIFIKSKINKLYKIKKYNIILKKKTQKKKIKNN